RHTSSDRDWSSDVCSSDLTSGASQSLSVPVDITVGGTPAPSLAIGDVRSQIRRGRHEIVIAVDNAGGVATDGDGIIDVPSLQLRSEERRVGKEGSVRISAV